MNWDIRPRRLPLSRQLDKSIRQLDEVPLAPRISRIRECKRNIFHKHLAVVCEDLPKQCRSASHERQACFSRVQHPQAILKRFNIPDTYDQGFLDEAAKSARQQ